MKDSSKGRVRGVIFTFMAAALWSTSFPVIKRGLANISAYNFVMLRFLISTLIIILITVILNRKNFLLYLKSKYIVFLVF